MNRLILVLIGSLSICLLNSCKENVSEKYDYHIHVHKPDAEDKKMGESMHIHVDFESKTGEEVHHVNVRIFNKETNEEVYNKPVDSHLDHSGNSAKHEHHDDFELSATNKITGHSNYILEAKVWGHDAGEAEVIKTLEFHVHPE